MLHATDSEKSVEVVDVHFRVLGHETMDRLIIVYGVSRADQLVGPPHVVDELPIV